MALPNKLRGAVGIVGIGESALGRVPDRVPLQLMAEAACNALADSGLDWADIDGIVTTDIHTESWSMPAGSVANAFSLSPDYLATVALAGASGAAMVHNAAMAIATGQCTTVLCVAGDCLRSSRKRSAAPAGLVTSGSAEPEFEAIYRPKVPSLYALRARAHMARFGTTSTQLAEVAVAIRGHAAHNPQATRRAALTVDEVLASPLVSDPLHALDCSLISDGAAAMIVTGADRARDLAKPRVLLLGQGFGVRDVNIGAADDLTVSAAVQSGRAAFAEAGLVPADIRVAQLYDCFTITVIIELEDLGFCKKGEGGAFVAGGRIGPGGSLPVTTHGGLLSCVHPGSSGGLFHVLEAVRQIRGEASGRQAGRPETALVHGNGGVLSLHCTLILGSPNVL